MPKQKKDYRKNFRFTEQISSMLEQRASELQISENELAANCIFSYLTDTKKFVECPTCKAYLAQIERLPITEGVVEFECADCKTQVWWDADTEKIIKVKKIK